MKCAGVIVIAATAAALVSGCDRSHQTADGVTGPGEVGSAAAAGNGTIASTGSPEQGGAGGTGPGMAATAGTINDIDRATPDSQAQGKANAAKQ